MKNIKSFLNSLPNQPGVYQMLGENRKVLYVGKARNLKKRVASYFSSKAQDIKTTVLLKHVKDIDITVTYNENEALLLECNLIKQHQPHYNVLFRDDKSFPYIVITNETPYPAIDFYRGAKKPGYHYFGPFPHAAAVRETIHLIQKLFGLRISADKYSPDRKRPCLQYQIGLCSGACAGLISTAEYAEDVAHAILFLEGKNREVLRDLTDRMEHAAGALQFEVAARFRDQISQLRDLQAKQYISTHHGNADVLGLTIASGIICLQLLTVRGGRILGSRSYFPDTPLHVSQEEIISSFISQHYLQKRFTPEDFPKEIITPFILPDADLLMQVLSEQAQRKITLASSVRGERKKWLEMATHSAKQALATQLFNKTNTVERFEALQQVLGLTHLPKRIECFDVSHTMGESTMASCVVFDKNGPAKSFYRRFNIREVTPGDDIAAIKQAIFRRFKRLLAEETSLPDILLIDGGKAQLAAAADALDQLAIQQVLTIGVAKGTTRKPGFETLYFTSGKEMQLPPDSLGLHLIQQIRDEAHRFAITGHRMQRDKKRVTSVLEQIPGIGAKRRRDLLRYFGGIQALNRASLEEIMKVPGINHGLAQRIFAALHP